MANSLGLTLYGMSARRETVAAPEPAPPRPAGRLIWLHAPQADDARSMAELARRLLHEDGHPVLLTCGVPVAPIPGVIIQPPPPDTQPDARAFLDHWKPDIALMAEGELRPALLLEARARQVPLLMVDGRAPHFQRERAGWYPGLVRSSLACFQYVLVRDEAAARAFRKAGATPTQIKLSGRMEEGSAALRCTEAERAALARVISTRPVWLAVGLPPAEEDAVIAAHHAALRLAHRLLLIIVPQDPSRAGELARRMEEAEGWAVARRAADQEPDAETAVYIADTASENGLWYRLAPITFLGGSLYGSGCLTDPLQAAALGSGIIHGPRPGAYGAVFGRLGAARAARLVASANDMAEALGDLLSPDRAARLAQAAWSVASDGVDVTDRVLELIRRTLGED
ncbi:3-deoxy-D-manno-octulosonic acid transferase [Rhodobacter ferrooxidans]|uniref:3-deoxy-D-manno-octulosonic acid transferase n=1 Tax=Rhodobacter ferrooxidans TaxID=371731 RepID=C8RW73_9RHOB|nr:glycosyltransferase N-terminal domain-containing protein [Rhodobacter sp. SW2]EEW26816.1 Three-deoxy-D-manno-octulosonic-acid transferase domain protein [Rhodobacter sp. SW2]